MSSIFSVGDLVCNQESGSYGTVVGYGHIMSNGAYQPTLRVQVSNKLGKNAEFEILEDQTSKWVAAEMQLSSMPTLELAKAA